jgi:hypothetical protein
MADQAELLPGTLDLLILKAISLGDVHGYGVLLRIEQITGGALAIQQGALYPAGCGDDGGADGAAAGAVTRRTEEVRVHRSRDAARTVCAPPRKRPAPRGLASASLSGCPTGREGAR